MGGFFARPQQAASSNIARLLPPRDLCAIREQFHAMPNENFDNIFKQCGQTFAIDWRLLKSLAETESGEQFNFLASGEVQPLTPAEALTVARKRDWQGSFGIMQINVLANRAPHTATVFDPRWNICKGAQILRQMLEQEHNVPNALRRYKGVDPRVPTVARFLRENQHATVWDFRFSGGQTIRDVVNDIFSRYRAKGGPAMQAP